MLNSNLFRKPKKKFSRVHFKGFLNIFCVVTAITPNHIRETFSSGLNNRHHWIYRKMQTMSPKTEHCVLCRDRCYIRAVELDCIRFNWPVLIKMFPLKHTLLSVKWDANAATFIMNVYNTKDLILKTLWALDGIGLTLCGKYGYNSSCFSKLPLTSIETPRWPPLSEKHHYASHWEASWHGISN